jgi:ryanodine receptor 2
VDSEPYEPKPIDTSKVELTEDIGRLVDRLAENSHDVWARGRMAQGWRYGPQRDDARREHPCLVPYDQLPDSEKEYDRNSAMETLKAVMALGYRIEKAG